MWLFLDVGEFGKLSDFFGRFIILNKIKVFLIRKKGEMNME